MSENQNAAAGRTGTSFNFSEVFWQKTAMLFGFYWLFRWLWPGILPESLQTASFQMQMLVCGSGGFFFTLLAALGHTAGFQSKANQK